MTADELTGWLMRVAAQGLGAEVHRTGDGAAWTVLNAVAAGHVVTVS